MSRVCSCRTSWTSHRQSSVAASGGCTLRLWCTQADVSRPLPCAQDTPVGLRHRVKPTGAAACVPSAPAALCAAAAATSLPVAPAAARSATAVAAASWLRTAPLRRTLSWCVSAKPTAAAVAATVARLSSSRSAARVPRAAQRLLLAFCTVAATAAATAAASRLPRASFLYSARHKMRHPSSLSPTLPVKAAAAVAAAGAGAAARDVVHMPRLLYGTAWKKEKTEDLVNTALRQGFRGVDTACQPKHYNEPGVGRGIARFLRETELPRGSLFIQTKFTPVGGHDSTQPLPYDARASISVQVQQSLQTSLHNLQCDYIDAVLLHSPLPTMEQTMEAWRVLEAAAESGKIRLLGISNVYDVPTLKALYDAAKIKPSLLQNRFYPDTGYDVEVRDFCKKHDIVYEAFWTLTANPHMLRSQAVQNAAAQSGATPQQVWFRYLLEKGFVVLTGTTSVHHMQEDLQSLSIEFSQQDRDAIDKKVASYT